MKTPSISAAKLPGIALMLAIFFPIANSPALVRFDMNAPGSATQDGWIAADLGTGSDGTVSIETVAVGDASVTLDSRDRTGGASDAGGGDEAAMWNDFIFANGSFDTFPGSGLQITITGLAPNTPYPLTLWAFDDASNVSVFPRTTDWSNADGEGGVLSFPSGPDPTTLNDYRLSFFSMSDEDGTIVLTGLVAAVDPSASHNVFINGLEVGDDADLDGLPDAFEQAIIDADSEDAINSVADVLPGDDFDNDGSTNADEYADGTDPVDDDTDDDGFKDGVENDGGTWVSAAETGTDPLDPDSDNDGLLDGVENHDLAYDPANPTTQPGSDPNLFDTDGDGVSDGTEVLVDGTDPTDADDFIDDFSTAIAKFDFNTATSLTQAGWTGLPLGNGGDGTISVTTVAIGPVNVDVRDRNAANTDDATGDIDNNDLWRDFVFANPSFANAPGSGLSITLTGLAPSTTYPITIWAFDESSNAQADGFPRAGDWGVAGEPAQATLTFPDSPDPTSLNDDTITIEVSTDASGQVVIEGIVAAVTPSTSHNVFINAMAIGQPTGSTEIRITALDLHPEGGDSSITWTSSPGKAYAIDLSTDLVAWPGDLDDGILAAEDAEETTYLFDASGIGPRVFYRVREIPN